MNNNFHSSVVREDIFLSGLHGLRGLAALCVVIFHLQPLLGTAPPDIFDFIRRGFGYSVYLFFALSAFSLMHSNAARAETSGWMPRYLIKRYFRIAPLFYVMIVFELGRQAFSGQIQQDAASILLNLSLFFGLIPYSTTSSFVWGGWSIGVEMVFYLVFPVFVLAARSRLAVALFVLMGIIISCSSRVELDEIFRQIEKLPSEWDKKTSYFAFSANIVFFTFGLCAYHFSKTIEKTSVWARYVLPGLTCVIIGGLLFTNVGTYFQGWGRMDLVFWGMGFGMLCLWQHANPGKIISGRLFNYVGERSFSIYLIHPVIVYLLKDFWVKIYEYFHVYLREYSFFVMAAAVLVVVMIVSEITYRFIEVPGVRMGKRLCARVA